MKTPLICTAVVSLLLFSSCDEKPARSAAAEAPLPQPLPPAEDEIVAAPQFAEFHEQQVREFANTSGMGWGRMMPRRFEPEKLVLADANGTRWRVDALQLVSLLEHESPRVYEIPDSTRHIRVVPGEEEKIPRPPVRALTAFEQAALAMVQEDPSFIAAQAASTDGRRRFVGAICARERCLKCHEDKRPGDLLGAFTWVLSPADETKGPAISMR